MSSFACELVRLDAVVPHPNADKLELAVIGGYRAVVAKDLHRAGELVLYVPEDSIIPPDVIEAWGFTGKLAGSKKNRVKAIKLRGELSQGLVIPARDVAQTIIARGTTQDVEVAAVANADVLFLPEGANVTTALGIEKYEEPIPIEMSGRQAPRPEWFPKYTDIENIKKYNRVLEEGEEVIITEKIHGTSFAAGLHRDNMDELVVSSRNVVLIEDEFNLYWRAAKKANLHALLSSLLHALPTVSSVVVFGEIYGHGVQDLAYGVPQGEIGFRAFDLMWDGRYVDHADFMEAVGAEADWIGEDDAGNSIFEFTSMVPMVPILYRGPWRDGLQDIYARGTDTISNSNVREGIVIRPVTERVSGKLGRVILKAISEDYLLRKGGTERT